MRPQHLGLAAAAVLLTGGLVVASMADGEPAKDVRLLSGAAWLPSAKVGQVTLLDGSSAEVAAQVQVAPAGNNLEVAQQGSTAYTIDQSAGTLRRVDGATFDLTPPGEPIPDTTSGLTAIPGPNVLYALDSQRGVLANTDPRDLTRRGELVTLASELASGSAAVDGAGTLWALDSRTGDVTYVANGERIIRREAAKPGPGMLAITDGNPVVVDVAGRKLIKIDRENGRPGGTIDLDLRTTDAVAVTGSTHSDRLYLVASRGVLTVCKVAAGKCDTTIPLNTGGRYGPAVEAGNQVFLPDYSTGQVWIIDAVQARVVAKPAVLTPPRPFQLLARDGVVFYNDTNSEQAGVIRFDGSFVQAAKYDPARPEQGLSGSQRTTSEPPQPGQTGVVTQPAQPSAPAQPLDPGSSQPREPASPPDPVQPDPGQPDPGQPDPARPDPGKPELKITISKATPIENEAVTLQVTNTKGDAPRSAHWTFGDGEEGDGLTTTHKWAAARSTPYQVSVKAVMPDNQEAVATVAVPVSETPKARLTVSIPGGGGTVTGGGISCQPTCSVDVLQHTQVTLTATPAATHQLGRWGGACSSTTNTCDVTLDAAKNVSYTFELKPAPKVTLTITAPNGGRIDRAGGGSCPGTCVVQLDPGTTVNLNAVSLSRNFYIWQGDCTNSQRDPRCTLTMSGNRTVSARYIDQPFLNSLTCQTNPGSKFTCTANGGPPEYTEGTRWRYGDLGVINHQLRLSTGCPSRDFDVTIFFAGLQKSARVQNCG